MTASTGCGSGSCGCAGKGAPEQQAVAAPSVNGIVLHPPGIGLDEDEVKELAWAELLRQEAVRQGRLPRHLDLEAPVLSAGDRQVVEAMLDEAVQVPQPTEGECRRYYEGRKDQFVQGQRIHARHILFAVTPGVNVPALAGRAEIALLELGNPKTAPGRFAELARELSNCPSSAQGGDLGWFGPEECAEELAKPLFQGNPAKAAGLHPRLVHSRHGFHIFEVLECEPGRQATFDEVRDRIAVQLAQQARARALHQYMQLLAGQALVEGVVLQEAATPLVQ
jgi:peptidyl-prolyl cis-trans isomerase C